MNSPSLSSFVFVPKYLCSNTQLSGKHSIIKLCATHPNPEASLIPLRLSVVMATAASATVFVYRLPSTTANVTRCSALLYLPPRLSTPSFSPSLKHFSDSRKPFLLQTRASSDDTSSPVDANELFTDLKEKWDAVENKTTVLLYGGGAIVAVWLSSILVRAINSVPLLPKIMELVGLGYTGWFVYRYLLFKSSRKELAADIEALKKQISGTE